MDRAPPIRDISPSLTGKAGPAADSDSSAVTHESNMEITVDLQQLQSAGSQFKEQLPGLREGVVVQPLQSCFRKAERMEQQRKVTFQAEEVDFRKVGARRNRSWSAGRKGRFRASPLGGGGDREYRGDHSRGMLGTHFRTGNRFDELQELAEMQGASTRGSGQIEG